MVFKILQAQPSHLTWIVLYVSSLNSNMVNPPSMRSLLQLQISKVSVYIPKSRRKMAKPSPSHVVLHKFWRADRKLKPCGSHPPAISQQDFWFFHSDQSGTSRLVRWRKYPPHGPRIMLRQLWGNLVNISWFSTMRWKPHWQKPIKKPIPRTAAWAKTCRTLFSFWLLMKPITSAAISVISVISMDWQHWVTLGRSGWEVQSMVLHGSYPLWIRGQSVMTSQFTKTTSSAPLTPTMMGTMQSTKAKNFRPELSCQST